MTLTICLAAAVLALTALLAWTIWRHAKLIESLCCEQAAERHALLEHLKEQREEAREERRQLADRIQHPERVQVQPRADYVPPELPKDMAELAYVGGIVPEFVNVGHAPGTLPGEGPPEEV
jgi:hypothetical protein